VVLFDRSFPPYSFLLPLPSLSPFPLALRQRPRLLRRRWCHPARDGAELRLVDRDGVHLQLRCAAVPLPLVDAVQLHFVRGAGCGCGAFCDCDFLRAAVSEGRDYAQLVGKRCGAEDGGCDGDAGVCADSWGHVWAFEVVLRNGGVESFEQPQVFFFVTNTLFEA
jgi:hypothetical protein